MVMVIGLSGLVDEGDDDGEEDDGADDGTKHGSGIDGGGI